MNTQVVLDTSVTISWMLPDEDQDAALHLRARAIEDSTLRLLVPPIFWSEITNVLTRASGDPTSISHLRDTHLMPSKTLALMSIM